MVANQQLETLNDNSKLVYTAVEHIRYMSVVGSIQCIAFVMRPDLAFTAHALARDMVASAKEHWMAAVHALRTLRTTMDLGLTLLGSSDNNELLEIYSDADFGNRTDANTVSGMVSPCVWELRTLESKRTENNCSEQL